MKILYIIASLQHPKIRGATRHYYFPRLLARNHDVTLLSLVRSHVETEALDDIRSFTRELHTFNINGEADSPLANGVAWLPGLGRVIANNLKETAGIRQMKRAFHQLVQRESFDVILFHGKSIFGVIEDWEGDLPIVTDFCDATSLRLRTQMKYGGFLMKPYCFFKWRSVRELEKRIVAKSPHLAFISCRDRSAVMGDGDRSCIVPLGVDHEYWRRQNSNYESNNLVFTGVMDYAPNHDAAMHLMEAILPRIKQQVPDARLFIVGRNPKPALLKAAQRHEHVTVTGFVDDVRPYLERAAVFAAPIRFASGSQNKVLEAMAMQTPVVTTSVVADGVTIDEYGEPPVIRTDDDDEFARQAVRLMQDASARQELAERAHRFVTRYFDWEASAARLEEMCLQAVHEQAATTAHVATAALRETPAG